MTGRRTKGGNRGRSMTFRKKEKQNNKEVSPDSALKSMCFLTWCPLNSRTPACWLPPTTCPGPAPGLGDALHMLSAA
ncbi:unnamed protein product [Pleuronectes platessa]|uniref:Uncharacterized protein n=1 Tax=Pleuronectes platessa TaxID=8262 RepID=A0A9N7VXX4_PLEPL|nr:unnamed protein product [Pleuronectes platessa]